jgi:23S rRNA U2552 (ribose-2'-O)-methylase RlmE/FtsJ
MNNLKKLFKNTKLQSTKWEKYFSIYDELLKEFKNKNVTFVEIGIAQGGSLEIWKKYFGKKAKIIGIDLNPNCLKLKKKGIEIFIGDQTDPNFWKKIFKKIGKVDVILDDGGHTNNQQISTIINTANNIKDGGKIIIEDTHTSYMERFGNPHRFSFINFAKKIIDDINYTYPFEIKKKFQLSLNKLIYAVSFYESIVEFKIDRKKCYENKFVDNLGLNSNFSDFRHENAKLLNI